MKTVKQIVHYIPSKYDIINKGQSAWVFPTDHTSPYVSNTQMVTTSKVVKVLGDGIFETLNSIYIPVGVEYE